MIYNRTIKLKLGMIFSLLHFCMAENIFYTLEKLEDEQVHVVGDLLKEILFPGRVMTH